MYCNKRISFILLAFVCVANVFAQVDEELSSETVSKGQYLEYRSTDKLGFDSFVLNEGNVENWNNWSYEGFRLEGESLSSGAYQGHTVCRAVSPLIQLPNKSQDLFLKLNSKLHSETYYDNAKIYVRFLNGDRDIVYNASGVKDRYDEYIDLHWYAGYKVQFEFVFESDDSFGGEGWDIYGVSVCSTSQMQAVRLYEPRLANLPNNQEQNEVHQDGPEIRSEVKLVLDSVQSVYVHGVTWDNDDHTKGVISFSLIGKNSAYDYLNVDPDNLNLFVDRFRLTVEDRVVDSCKLIKRDSSCNQVDIIYAVDCSASMDPSQKKLAKGIETLNKRLQSKYDLRSAALFFRDGKGDCDSKVDTSIWRCVDFKSDYTYKQELNNEGSRTHCYSVFKYLCKKNLSYNDMSQKVIVLLGNDDYADCYMSVDYETNEGTLTQTEISKILRDKGFQTFVIYNQYRPFSDITKTTHGEFIMSENGTMLFDPNIVVSSISESIENRYYMEFCLPDTTHECKRVMKYKLELDSKSDSINATRAYYPDFELADTTVKEMKDTLCFNKVYNDSLLVQFELTNYCEDDTLRNVRLFYGINDDTSFVRSVPAHRQSDGVTWSAYIPLDDAISSIHYRVSSENTLGKVVFPKKGAQFVVDGKSWYDFNMGCTSFCGNVRLSGNPVRKDDSITIEFGQKDHVTFQLLDNDGKKLNDNLNFNKTLYVEKGERTFRFDELFGKGFFSGGLDPLHPYLLVISNGKEVFMTYLYISRI